MENLFFQNSEQNTNPAFTVSQLTSIISEVLQTNFRNITIEGEISNYKPSAAGHVYFTLKDSNAALSAVIFKGSLFRLNFQPKDGDKVRCTGSISVYAPRGSYQLVVSKMEMAGSGNILQMLEQRKQKLASEGLFDTDKKKALPLIPQTIGVVTSPTGAAIRDILQITKRRNPNVNVIILPAVVQGADAALSIVKMIEIANFYKLCDVLIVGRGGGSLEDLLPFSEESVVRAVASSEIPTISAVGHEIDWALCDYAADKRAATPSAAAELAVPLFSDLQQSLQFYKENLYSVIKQKIEKTRLLIKSFNPDSLEIRFRTIQQPLLNRYANAKENLEKNMLDKIKEARNKIDNCRIILENASPDAIFAKGYSMVCNKETGKIIRNADEISCGEKISVTVAKGNFDATVD